MSTKFCYSTDNLPVGPLSAGYPEEVHLPLPPDASPHVQYVTSGGTVVLDLGGEKPVVLPLNLRRIALEGQQKCEEYLGLMGTAALAQSQVEFQARSADDLNHLQGLLLQQIWATVLTALEPALSRIRAQETAINGAAIGLWGQVAHMRGVK